MVWVLSKNHVTEALVTKQSAVSNKANFNPLSLCNVLSVRTHSRINRTEVVLFVNCEAKEQKNMKDTTLGWINFQGSPGVLNLTVVPRDMW